MAATLAACAAIVCGPLLAHRSLPLGSDVYSTNHYLQGFMKAFGEGDFYPRWTDLTNQGLGAPSFVMLPPLVYYGAGAASWMTGSLVGGFKLWLLVVCLLSGISFYALARQWIGPGLPSAIAAGIYLLLPYHVLDMYQRFAISETAAFIFFPAILLFARRAVLVGRARDVTGLSLSYAGLVYTHIVSALCFSLLFGIWLLWEGRGSWRGLLRPVLGLACGLALAAPALLPAVVEKSDANIAFTREMPNGDFRINFIFRDDLLPGLGIKDPVKPPVLKSAHSQLLLAVIAAGIALTWTPAPQHRRRRDVLALGSGCVLAYLLQLEISTPIWNLVPELPSIQFPWRFQTIMVLTSAMLSGFALSAGWGRAAGAVRRSPVETGAILLGLVLLGNLVLAWQNSGLKPFEYDESVGRQPFVVSWIEPAFTPVQFEPYRSFKQTPIDMPQASFVKGAGDVTVGSWRSSSRELRAQTAQGGTVALRAFWFPGWSATMDGHPLELKPAAHMGVVTFVVPAGTHDISMRFTSTPVRRTAGRIGLAGLLLTPAVAWACRRLPGPASGAPPASGRAPAVR